MKKTSHYMYSKDAVTSNYVLQCSRIPLYNKLALKGKPLYNKAVLKYTSLWKQCLSPLTWVRILFKQGVLDTTLCDKVCQWLRTGRWLSLGTPVSSTKKIDLHNLTEIFLKVASNTITLTLTPFTIRVNISLWIITIHK